MFDDETTPHKAGFVLVSGEKLARDNPNTFEIPPRKKRESLDVGHFAKLVFKPTDPDASPLAERMWVKITSVGSKNYEGTLANKPKAGLKGILQWGDLVQFSPQHIIDLEMNP